MRQTKDNTERVKKRIIEEAVKEFDRCGYACANLQQIAKNAGVSRGPLYYHFQNKGELYLAAAQSMVQQEQDAYHTILDENKPVLSLLHDDFEYCLKTKRLAPFLNRNADGAPDIPLIHEYFAWLHQRKKHLLSLAKLRGELRADCDVDELLTFLYVYYWGIATAKAQKPGEGFPLHGKVMTDSVSFFLELVQDKYLA